MKDCPILARRRTEAIAEVLKAAELWDRGLIGGTDRLKAAMIMYRMLGGNKR